MKAFVLDRYGPPEALRLAEIDRPTPTVGEVLVRVHATSVNPYDWHHLRGEPYLARLMPGTVGLRRPGLRILGADIAGQVVAAGPQVTGIRPGSDTFALLRAGGGFGEYVSVPAKLLAPMPANLTHAQAAAVPIAGVTAMLGVRAVRTGERVLINGASGGVGTFAVQIAHARGAVVTAVCGARNADLVRALGADEVIDYGTTDFTHARGPSDRATTSCSTCPAARGPPPAAVRCARAARTRWWAGRPAGGCSRPGGCSARSPPAGSAASVRSWSTPPGPTRTIR